MSPLMLSLIASAGLGAVIGLIRQWHEQSVEKETGEYRGIRTFTFMCMLGCVAAFLSDGYSAAIFPVVVVAVAAHAIFGPGSATNAAGSTGFMATLLTLLIGALVAWDFHKEAVVIAALTVVLLGLKRPIHDWTRKFTEADIRATLQFVAITGVILPLVPNQAFGPFDGFNLHTTWMMVVLISAVGFAGYVLMRLLDARAGIVLTSLLGGLASSTATTLAFSRRSREDPVHSEHYALAVALACTVMLPRLLIVLSVVNASLAKQLLLPLGLMVVPGIACAAFVWWRHRGKRSASRQPEISNPLGLGTAIKFALLFAAINFGVKAAEHFGHLKQSLLPLAFVSGLTDVDAITLSIAKNLHGESADSTLAAKAIILATIANSALKAGLAAAFGSAVLRRWVLVTMALVIGCGLAGFFLVGDERFAPAP